MSDSLKKAIRTLYYIFVIAVLNFFIHTSASAAGYTPRLSLPGDATTSLTYYSTSSNPYAPYINIGNCTWYAFGRAWEILGYYPEKLVFQGDAEVWFNKNKENYDSGKGGFPYSTDRNNPALGAIAVWENTSNAYGEGGHVAVVEQIDDNGNGTKTVTTSESGWGSYYFQTIKRSTAHEGLGMSGKWKFLGYIFLGDYNPIDHNMPNPKYVKSYWGAKTATTIRPVVEVANPETVDRVRFPVWAADDQSDIKWIDAVYNGYGSFFADVPIAGFKNSNYKCHVYIKGKNGSERCYVLTEKYPDPVYRRSYWGQQNDSTRRPVIEFVNPDMVEGVRFAMWTASDQSDIKWVDGHYNGYACWFYDFNASDFNSRDFKCHAYVTGKNGSLRFYIITSNLSDPDCKKLTWVMPTESTLRPVIEFNNADMVESVRFAIWTTSDHSDIKWVDGQFNGYACWSYDFNISDFSNRVFNCHLNVKGKNGSEQVIAMPANYNVEKKNYSIVYHLDGGKNAEGNPVEFTDDEVLNILDPNKEHYSFKGWYLSETGDEQFENGTSYSKDLELYARWEKIQYQITLYANHIIDSDSEVESWTHSVTYGDPFGELPVPEWKGHTFIGWFTEETNGSQITEESLYTTGSSFYAHWIQNPVHVTFDGNAVYTASLQEYAKDKTTGELYGELPEISLPGYDFLGWFTQRDGGTEVTSDTAITMTEDHVLYARWKTKEYSLIFDSNLESINNPAPRTIKYKEAFGELPTLSAEGYDFLGWFDAVDGNRRFTDKSTYNYTSDITLHAKWMKQGEPHAHSYEGKVTTKPTCTEPGIQTYICTGCNDSYTEEIPANGHTPETERKGVKKVTCTENGYTGDILCSTCGAVLEKGEVIPATGHQTEIRDAKVVSCMENGYTGDTWCVVCEQKILEGEVIEASGHDWEAGEIKKDVSCKEAGEQEYTCSHCGEKKTEPIPVTGHLGEPMLRFVKVATCTEDGYTGDVYCDKCYELIKQGERIPATHHLVIRNKKEATCTNEGNTGDSFCVVCEELIEAGSIIPKKDHSWDQGTVTKTPTETQDGIRTYTCTKCGTIKTEQIKATGSKEQENVKETTKPVSKPVASVPTKAVTEKDAWGNVLVSEKQMEKNILTQPNDQDPSGSSFSLLQATMKKATKSAITVSWKKVPGATSYTVYGNRCGKGRHYKRLSIVSGTKYVYKGLKKGTYYKLLIVANKSGKTQAVSKTLHIATSGGKVGNPTKVKLNKKTVTLKKGKSKKLKATVKKGKLKVKKHRSVKWESSDPTVATVSGSGRVKALKAGKATIYAYAQNGKYAKCTVTVK